MAARRFAAAHPEVMKRLRSWACRLVQPGRVDFKYAAAQVRAEGVLLNNNLVAELGRLIRLSTPIIERRLRQAPVRAYMSQSPSNIDFFDLARFGPVGNSLDRRARSRLGSDDGLLYSFGIAIKVAPMLQGVETVAAMSRFSLKEAIQSVRRVGYRFSNSLTAYFARLLLRMAPEMRAETRPVFSESALDKANEDLYKEGGIDESLLNP